MAIILTCTDGSVYAPSVYDHSTWAAKRMGAGIHVLHMLDPHRERAMSADFSGHLNPDEREALMDDLVALEETANRVAQNRGRALLEAARSHLKEAGVENVSVEQRHGSLVESLDDFSADLVVIGKRGESADFAKLHLGANLERVIRGSHRPVLVASRAFQAIERFLIAFDGSSSARKAVAYAAEEPLLKNLSCTLVMAGKADREHELEAARDQLAQAGYKVDAKILPGEPETAIAETIEKEGIHLLIMGAYGHSKIRQLIVGSTTTIMVRTCRIPVLMFR